MTESEQERTGLVETHAYAVLDLRKVEVPIFFLLIIIYVAVNVKSD